MNRDEKDSYMNYQGRSDPGKVRKTNEDTYIIEKIWDETTVLAAVIDGVGGYAGGAQAAAIARESIVSYLHKYRNGEQEQLLKEAVTEANNHIAEARLTEPQFANMSCVLSVMIADFAKMKFVFAHVGDTRLYTFSDGQLEKVTHDHSLVGYREEIGELSEEEAMAHPQRNMISRDIGSAVHNTDDKDFIDSGQRAFNPGTTLLLCSDGLTDIVPASEVAGILDKQDDLDKAAEALIAMANAKGGPDNITVVLVNFPDVRKKQVMDSLGKDQLAEPPVAPQLTLSPPVGAGHRARRWWWIAGLLAILALVAGYWALNGQLSDGTVPAVKTADTAGHRALVGTLKKEGLLREMLLLKSSVWTAADTSLKKSDTVYIKYPLVASRNSTVFDGQHHLVVLPADTACNRVGLIIIGKGVQIKGLAFRNFKDSVLDLSSAVKAKP